MTEQAMVVCLILWNKIFGKTWRKFKLVYDELDEKEFLSAEDMYYSCVNLSGRGKEEPCR